MFLITLGASLFGNVLTAKGTLRGGQDFWNTKVLPKWRAAKFEERT